jgi:HMG (high mobility group) box
LVAEVRDELKGQDFTFSEIAKFVGERWQVLPHDIRVACERKASAAKERYYTELAEYKKTPEYAQYQDYLADFKAKHRTPTAGKYEHIHRTALVRANRL